MLAELRSEKSFFSMKSFGFFDILFLHFMSARRFRSGKHSSTNSESVTKQEKVTNPEETAMCEEVMAELKSMRGDLKNQISALSENLKVFQRNTNARLEKIESVISKLDEIDVLTTNHKDLEKDFEGMKASVDAMNATVSEMDRSTQRPFLTKLFI